MFLTAIDAPLVFLRSIVSPTSAFSIETLSSKKPLSLSHSAASLFSSLKRLPSVDILATFLPIRFCLYFFFIFSAGQTARVRCEVIIFLPFGRPVSLPIIFVFGMQILSCFVTFIVSIPSFESMALESVMVKSIKGSVSLLTVGSFPSTSSELVIAKSISLSLSLLLFLTTLESVIAKSTKGSFSLQTLVSFPLTSCESVIVKSMLLSLSESTTLESVTAKSTNGSVSLLT